MPPTPVLSTLSHTSEYHRGPAPSSHGVPCPSIFSKDHMYDGSWAITVLGMRMSCILARLPNHSSLLPAIFVATVSRSPHRSLVNAEVIRCCHCCWFAKDSMYAPMMEAVKVSQMSADSHLRDGFYKIK